MRCQALQQGKYEEYSRERRLYRSVLATKTGSYIYIYEYVRCSCNTIRKFRSVTLCQCRAPKPILGSVGHHLTDRRMSSVFVFEGNNRNRNRELSGQLFGRLLNLNVFLAPSSHPHEKKRTPRSIFECASVGT